MKLQTITRPHDFINVSADFILKICRNNGKKTRINIALSGGSTPKEIYETVAKKLSFMPLTNEIHFYQVDERYVPATDNDSNQKMIREAFSILKNPGSAIEDITFHFFDTSLTIKKALTKYSKELPKIAFDLTILGIGPDGHIASLFPDSTALKSKSTVAQTTTENFAIKNRLTLTLPPILKSENILVLLKNKPDVLTELKTPTKSATEFPAHKLAKHENLTIFATN